jgi:hypothetical protein
MTDEGHGAGRTSETTEESEQPTRSPLRGISSVSPSDWRRTTVLVCEVLKVQAVETDRREASYIVLPNFFSREICDLLYEYVLLKQATNQLMRPDTRIPVAPRLYGDPLTETLLLRQQALVERAAAVPLFPSYSYVRLHDHGAAMPSHTDREASEIGVSIHIGGDQLWPLWFQQLDGPVSVTLDVGDAVMYRGRETKHWREPYPGDRQVQCILFYVQQNGACASHRFDGRAGIGMPRTAVSPEGRKAEVPM